MKEEKKVNGWLIILLIIVALLIITPIILHIRANMTAVNKIYGENGVVDRTKDLQTENVIGFAKDDVELAIQEAYYDYTNNNNNAEFSEYINQALKKIEDKVSKQGAVLMYSEDTVSIMYNGDSINGTISDNGKVIWSE